MTLSTMFLRVALHSLIYRKNSALLTILSVTVSIFVLLGVEHIRQEAKTNFSKTVSGVDLIVGARTSNINLLLYSVFRVGTPTNNISWASYQNLIRHDKVAWSIPMSLGDSHKGYRVVGTTTDYFTHFKYGQNRSLDFTQGNAFSQVFDVVLGAEVAKKLDYKLGKRLVLAHGIAKDSFSLHSDKPFKVVGILERTGTPVDNALYVSLQGIEAIHLNWQSGVNLSGQAKADQSVKIEELTPKNITALMLGLKSKISTFQVQHHINNFPKEPLLAILPGVALSELWQLMSLTENILRSLSILIFIAAILGLAAMLLASMRERKNELMILRSIGATPVFIFTLLVSEALLMVAIGVLSSMLLLVIAIYSTNEFLTGELGMTLSLNFLNSANFLSLLAVFCSTLIISLIPAIKAYRMSLVEK